ncbi:MAG: hypothetical protein IPI97_14415 [Nitrosomonas sp.]|nr:hypothetical protein [Nitrosomonas sp.]
MLRIVKLNYAFSHSWIIGAKVGMTAAILIWFFAIWSSTADLNAELRVLAMNYSSIYGVEVEFKSEIQEWKNVLLRSNSRDSLNKNWQVFENQYQNVSKKAQDILTQSNEREIRRNLQEFLDAHASNHSQYLKSVDLLVRSGYDPRPADLAVKGIDRTLLDYLDSAEAALQDKKNNLEASLTAKTLNHIEQILIAIVFLSVIVLWMPSV